jgi:hypothetical protein
MSRKRPSPLLTIATLIIVLIASAFPAPTPAAAAGGPPVVAMYYAWFDGNSWNPAGLSDLPTQDYSSADRGTIER